MSQDRNTRDKPTHGHQISSKGRKNIQGRKSASISGIGKSVQLHTHTHTHKEHFLTCSLNAKQIKFLNVDQTLLKLSEENIGIKNSGINCNKMLFNSPLRVMKIKTK